MESDALTKLPGEHNHLLSFRNASQSVGESKRRRFDFLNYQWVGLRHSV
jgi:hypothetical protein